jgi:hypothetical protein
MGVTGEPALAEAAGGMHVLQQSLNAASSWAEWAAATAAVNNSSSGSLQWQQQCGQLRQLAEWARACLVLTAAASVCVPCRGAYP